MQATMGYRVALARRGCRLEWFTISCNCLEGLVDIVAGAIAGSVSLLAFGIDSAIEVVSGTALLWRMCIDADTTRREQRERLTLRIVATCFMGLAVYIAVGAVLSLVNKELPEHSPVGIALACASLIVMPLLARAKRKVGLALQSEAMKADAKQSSFCAYLAAILFVGLALNAFFGLWWADPAAALIMAFIVGHEGIETLKGKKCD